MKSIINDTTYTNSDIFLVEILGMTNWCNLRCEYCDWKKMPYKPFTMTEKQNVRKNLECARFFIKTHFPAARMIEYSGGEPFYYPEVVMDLLDVFPDYWIRVITNGILVKPEHLDRIQKHGKTYLAISLDGPNVAANNSRRIDVKQFERIIQNIDECMKREIPVMILCTLNEDNTSEFFAYIDFLYKRWGKYIDSGLLVLPAHVLSSYDVAHRSASKVQKDEFKKFIQNTQNPLITRIQAHYDEIFSKRATQCTVYQWATSMHFIGNEIANTGVFTTFRCGMRGVGKIGSFSVRDEIEKDTYSEVMSEALKKDFASFRCNCTVDWDATDKIIAGVIDVDAGAKWFKPFKDPNIQQWIKDHKKHFQIAYTRGGKMKNPKLCKRYKS